MKVLYFSATWCGPCKAIKPIVQKWAKEHIDEFEYIELDVDKEPVLTGEYNIKSVPTVVFVVEGRGAYLSLVGNAINESELNLTLEKVAPLDVPEELTMEKLVSELWSDLQGLDKEAQLRMLEEFAEELYGDGFKDGYEEAGGEDDPFDDLDDDDSNH